MNTILCGDVLQTLPKLPQARTIIADPPDNLGLKYDGFTDRSPHYIKWLHDVTISALLHEPQVFWLSHYYRYTVPLLGSFTFGVHGWDVRLFIWRFTFGQHRTDDCGNGYRPILRFSRPGVEWDTDNIHVPSARQKKYGDKRANPDGRVPDDVWEFSRVCGTFKERRPWHPTQHPEALIERIVKMSGGPVIDMFAGTGTCAIVCQRLGIDCTSIEISESYCDHIRKELGT